MFNPSPLGESRLAIMFPGSDARGPRRAAVGGVGFRERGTHGPSVRRAKRVGASLPSGTERR
jgi:hypothetical protein